MPIETPAALRLPTLLTVDQAAEVLNKRPKTIRNMISLRQIEVIRIGRSVRVSAESLANLIEAGRVPAA